MGHNVMYLYGLLEADAPVDLSALDGINGPVCVTPCGGAFLIHGAHDGGEIMPRRRHLLRHAKVLETAMGHGTVLPMRFGMVSASVVEIETRIATQAAAVEQAFARVRGRVELGVRITVPEAAALEAVLRMSPDLARARDDLANAGRSGHFAKAEFGRHLGEALARRRAQAQKALLAELTQNAEDHVLRAPETDTEALRAEFLVAQDKVAEFTDRVAALSETLDLAQPEPADAQVIGPGPAYHFVTLALGTASDEAAA